jgi:hypothetical protein
MNAISLLAGRNTAFSAGLKWRRAFALAVAFAVLGGSSLAQAPQTEIATDTSPSLDVLLRARKHVQEYFDKFSDLAC